MPWNGSHWHVSNWFQGYWNEAGESGAAVLTPAEWACRCRRRRHRM